jgi:signal peptidase
MPNNIRQVADRADREVGMKTSSLRWAGPATTLVATVVVAALGGLMIWTVLPLIVGWKPSVVLTGSMMPRIHPGDVVVIRPVRTDQLRVKHVIRFADPAIPGRYLVHRIAYIRQDGTLVTRGDANPSADSTPVPLGNVDGVALLRVPYVGLPVVWLRDKNFLPLVPTGMVALLVLYGLTRRPDFDDDLDPPAEPVAAAIEPPPVGQYPTGLNRYQPI